MEAMSAIKMKFWGESIILRKGPCALIDGLKKK